LPVVRASMLLGYSLEILKSEEVIHVRSRKLDWREGR
jgi:hypothetical protein